MVVISPRKSSLTPQQSVTVHETVLKIMLLGDSSVGKTQIFHRITKATFSPHYKPTAGIDFSSMSLKIQKGNRIKAQVVDTSGLERYRSVTQSYWNLANGAIIVYDISNRATFLSLHQWLNDLKAYFKKQSKEMPVMMMIGNKSDCQERQVETEEAQQFALSQNLLFMECSALNGDNVSLAFNIFALDVYHYMESAQKMPKMPVIPALDSLLHPVSPVKIDAPVDRHQRPKSFDEIFYQSLSSLFRSSTLFPVSEQPKRSPDSACDVSIPKIEIHSSKDDLVEPVSVDQGYSSPLQRSHSIAGHGRRTSRYI